MPAGSASTDVIVVGSGAAGLVAAATAVSAGARVTVLERAEEVGGTATRSVGEFWIPNNRHLRHLGIPDPEPECLALMGRLSYPDRFDPESPTLGLSQLQYDLLVTYYRRSSEAIEHLESVGALHSKISPAAYGDPLGHPEYYADLPENRVPQGRHLIVDNGDSQFGLRGRAYVEQLSAYVQRCGADVRTGQRVIDVDQDRDGRVIAVIAESASGLSRFEARRGVIFTTGGFGHDPAARSAFLPAPVDGVAAVTTNTGDFLRIASGLGAQLGNMTHAYLGNTPFEQGAGGQPIPALIHFPFGDSMLWVDCSGRRVVNEKGVFTDRARAHFTWDAGARGYGQRVLIQLFDRTVLEAPGARSPLPMPGEPDGRLMVAGDWTSLAGLIDERLARFGPVAGGLRLAPEFTAALARTLDRYNAHASEGRDPDFGRGSTPIQTCYEQPLHPGQLNPCLAPLAGTGPYGAVLIGAAMFDTAGGPVIDAGGAVLNVAGQRIPGLFAAGCAAASPGGQGYWSGGGPIGLALTFGYLAGRSAASEPDTAASDG